MYFRVQKHWIVATLRAGDEASAGTGRLRATGAIDLRFELCQHNQRRSRLIHCRTILLSIYVIIVVCVRVCDGSNLIPELTFSPLVNVNLM
jgi:hypothetical protein